MYDEIIKRLEDFLSEKKGLIKLIDKSSEVKNCVGVFETSASSSSNRAEFLVDQNEFSTLMDNKIDQADLYNNQSLKIDDFIYGNGQFFGMENENTIEKKVEKEEKTFDTRYAQYEEK